MASRVAGRAGEATEDEYAERSGEQQITLFTARLQRGNVAYTQRARSKRQPPLLPRYRRHYLPLSQVR